MVATRVFFAVVWLLNLLAFSATYLRDEKMTGQGWFIVVAGMVYTTLSLIADAIDAVDETVDGDAGI